MAAISDAEQVVLHGYWLDEDDGGGVDATITLDPVKLTGQSGTTPNLKDLTGFAHIKTRSRVTTPNPTTGYYAVLALASNDPDVDAYGGRQVTFQGYAPYTIQVPYNAATTTVDAKMATAIPSLTIGQTVRALWLIDAPDGSSPPTPVDSYYTSDQTNSVIATAIAGVSNATFTQSATKTATYTAAANEIVPLDTSGGTFTLTGPSNGKPFGARWKTGTAAPTIAAPSGYTINGAATVTMGLAPGASSGELVVWQAFGTDYQPLQGFKPQTALDGRYAPAGMTPIAAALIFGG